MPRLAATVTAWIRNACLSGLSLQTQHREAGDESSGTTDSCLV
jgi:hypothetical protein